MMEEWAAALEGTGFATALRGSVWTYPLVNAGHILGVALLVGATVPLDLRLIGVWRSTPMAPLWRVLTRTAGTGFILAVVCGIALFAAKATEYTASALFLSKMAVVALGTANAFLLLPRARTVAMDAPQGKTPVRFRLAGGISLAAWLTALTLGRLVGYF